jgi:hypothetical protein
MCLDYPPDDAIYFAALLKKGQEILQYAQPVRSVEKLSHKCTCFGIC